MRNFTNRFWAAIQEVIQLIAFIFTGIAAIGVVFVIMNLLGLYYDRICLILTPFV